jgi:hypothetical protein
MEHQDFLPNIETWWGELPNLYGTKMFTVPTKVKACQTSNQEME